MPTKIFVGRLIDGTTSEDISSLFRKFGHVTECDVLQNFGFVVSATIIFTFHFFTNLLILCWVKNIFANYKLHFMMLLFVGYLLNKNVQTAILK